MSRKSGKIIDHIPYVENGHNFLMPLRMENRSASRVTPHYRYSIHMDSPVSVSIEGGTPEEVIAKAKAAVDQLLTVEWKRFLHVRAEKDEWAHSHSDTLRQDFSITVNTYEIAEVNNSAGRYRYRTINPYTRDDQAARGMERPGLPMGVEMEDLLPYTKELLTELENLMDRFRQLRDAIDSLLKPAQIESTLKRINTAFALKGIDHHAK